MRQKLSLLTGILIAILSAFLLSSCDNACVAGIGKCDNVSWPKFRVETAQQKLKLFSPVASVEDGGAAVALKLVGGVTPYTFSVQQGPGIVDNNGNYQPGFSNIPKGTTKVALIRVTDGQKETAEVAIVVTAKTTTTRP